MSLPPARIGQFVLPALPAGLPHGDLGTLCHDLAQAALNVLTGRARALLTAKEPSHD